jgi:predicted transcriptional regulator
MSESPADPVPLFARREALLRALAAGAVRKGGLVDRLDVSRSTVDRSLRALTAAGMVDRGDDGYELTLRGRFLYGEYRRFRDRARGVDRSDCILEVLPTDAPVDPILLADATVVESTRRAPYRPVDAHVELLGSATAMQIVSTAATGQYVDRVSERVDDGMELSLACTPHVLDRLVSEYSDKLQRAFESGRVELRELASSPPLGLAVIEHADGPSVSVLVYADDGIRGHLRNDDPAAVEWAEAFLERHWTWGDRLGPLSASGS